MKRWLPANPELGIRSAGSLILDFPASKSAKKKNKNKNLSVV